jgi:hypothetical protein
MATFWRNLITRATLICSLGFIGLPLIVALSVPIVQTATYGVSWKLLAFIGLVLGGYRFAVRIRRPNPVQWERSWGMAALISASVFLFSNQLIVRGLAVGIWDADGEMFPFQALVSDFARAGKLIHWDPWSDGGIALASDPSVGAYSPLNVTVGLITGGTSTGFSIYWLFVWALGGFGMLMVARQLKAPAWAAALVAIGFLFSGGYTGNAEHTSCIVAFSFLPIVVWRLDVALVTGDLRPAAEAGALWGLSALSGYPALTITNGFFCVLWAVGRIAFRDDGEAGPANEREVRGATHSPIRARFRLLMTILAILVIVGFAVLSPTYHTFFAEGIGTTVRSKPLPREVVVSSNALHPGALTTLASPYLAALKAANQIKGDGQLWRDTDLSMCSIYSGVAITIFAVFSIFSRPRDRWRWSLVILGALSIACAVGGFLPLRGWMYDWIYPTRFFRHPALFGSYAVFIISVLAILGLRDLLDEIGETDRINTWRRFQRTALACSTMALATFFAVISHLGAQRSISLSKALLVWLLVSGTWLAVPGLALIFGNRANAPAIKHFPILLLLLSVCDAILTCDVSKGHMISTDAAAVARWDSLDSRHSSILNLTANGLKRESTPCVSTGIPTPVPQSDSGSAVECPWSDQLITKIPVLESYSSLSNPFLRRIAKSPTLKGMAIGKERTWFSTESMEIPITDEWFEAWERRAQVLHTAPLVIHSRRGLVNQNDDGDALTSDPDYTRLESLPPCQLVFIRLDKYTPEELYFETSCPADGWLLITDRWGPSWQAEVNGVPTEVLGANFVFRAVRVRAGDNIVRFTYNPSLFPWLLILSWATLCAIVVSAITSAIRLRKKRQIVLTQL